jgi:hypothetical protein
VIGRVFRIVRTPLTLLILLGVLCWGAWWGYTNLLKPTPPTPPTPCVNQKVNQGELRSDQVTVSVFNGGSKKGLAGDVGRSLRQRGFKVTKTSNTSQKVQKTVILGAGAKNPEVLLVRRFFKDAQIKVDKRPDHSVDVLVGNDYGGFNKKAEKTLAVKSKTVCLPPQASSTAPAVDS